MSEPIDTEIPSPGSKVKKFLERELEMYRLGGSPVHPVSQFILEHGQPFRGIPRPKELTRGRSGRALVETAAIANDVADPNGEYAYAEGFVTNPSALGHTYYHAWLVRNGM